MHYANAIETLLNWSRQGRVIFTRNELRLLFPDDGDAAFKAGVDRLVVRGVLHRISRGVFVFALAERGDPYMLERIAALLRRGAYSYLSLESALSEYGVISQVPLAGITVMTTGRAGMFRTPYGRIEFTHTKRGAADILDRTRDVGRPLRLATPEAAARDLRRVGRNVHLIDPEVLEEVMALDAEADEPIAELADEVMADGR